MKLGFVTSDFIVTDEGNRLLYEALGVSERVVVSNRFDEFFKIFPKTDAKFGHKKTRHLATGREEARAVYNRLISSGVSEETIIEGLKEDLKVRDEAPDRFANNPYKYMKGPVRWLSDQEFMNQDIQSEPERRFDSLL